MNWSQAAGIIRIVGPAIIAVLAYMGFISDSVAGNLTAMILSVAGSAAWSAIANTDLNLSKAVAAVPGLSVHVSDRAPPELKEAAADPTVIAIVPAVPSTLSPQRLKP